MTGFELLDRLACTLLWIALILLAILFIAG